jgi:hypothetical protein
MKKKSLPILDLGLSRSLSKLENKYIIAKMIKSLLENIYFAFSTAHT